MATQAEILKTMSFILDTLVENAKRLNEGVKLMLASKELEALQEKQHELLNELARLDALVKSSKPGTSGEEVDFLRSEVRHKIVLFQGINNEFFQRVNLKSRVIEKGDFIAPPSKGEENEG